MTSKYKIVISTLKNIFKKVSNFFSYRISSNVPSIQFIFSIYFVFLYLIISFIIRILDFIILSQTSKYNYYFLKPPFTIPFLFGEDILVASGLALILYFSLKNKYMKSLCLAFLSTYLIFLSFDQMAYKYYFSHLNFTIYRECHDFVSLWSSIVASVDIFFLIAFVAAIAAAILLWVPWRPNFIKKFSRLLISFPQIFLTIALIWVGSTYFFLNIKNQYDLHRTFIGEAVITYFIPFIEEKVRSSSSDWFLKSTIFGTPQHEEDFNDLQEIINLYNGKLNVIFYVMESTPFWETSMNPKNRYDTTPFLKKMASEGVLFKNFYAVYPASTRANYSYLTGLYPYMGGYSDIRKYSGMRVTTLPDILHDHGYATAIFASTDTWFDSFNLFLQHHSFDKYFDTNKLPQQEKNQHYSSTWGVEEEIVIELALDWIEDQNKSKKPFFLYYIGNFPHHPYFLPDYKKEFLNRNWSQNKKNYQASLLYTDTAIQYFYESLEKLGILDDTVFIVAPDHGEAFGDLHHHRIHNMKIYEETNHIFLLFYNSKALGVHKISSRVGSQADFLPTILDILRIKGDYAFHGQSLISMDYQERPIYLLAGAQIGMRDGNYKFIENKSKHSDELYDLKKDPQEQKDIASENQDKIAIYKILVKQWEKSMEKMYLRLKGLSGATNSLKVAREVSIQKEIESEKKNLIENAYVCLENESETATPPTGEQVFPVQSKLVLKILWARPGSYAPRIILNNPKGKTVFNFPKLFKNVYEYSIVPLNLAPPYPVGKYKGSIELEHKEYYFTFRITP